MKSQAQIAFPKERVAEFCRTSHEEIGDFPLVSKLQLGNPKMFDQAPLGLVGEAELRRKNTFPSWSLGTCSTFRYSF